jgi:hypothetical protein
VRDENLNPGTAAHGSPPTDLAVCAGIGGSFCVREATAGWELHGLLCEFDGAIVLFSYAKSFRPVVQLADFSGLSLFDVRGLLAEVANCTAGYSREGAFLFKSLPVATTPTVYWPDGGCRRTSSGWRDIYTRLTAVPWAATTDNAFSFYILQTAQATGSTGMLNSIGVGTPTADIELRVVFVTGEPTPTYDVYEAGVTAPLVTGQSIITPLRGAGWSLGPENFGGSFVAGDTFTVNVMVPGRTLAQKDFRSKTAAESTAAVGIWGRIEAAYDNRFTPETLIKDTLTARLVATASPRQAFELDVDPDFPLPALFTQRLLPVRPGMPPTPVALYGFARKFGAAPEMTLKLNEVA